MPGSREKRICLAALAVAVVAVAPGAQAATIKPTALTDGLTNNGNCTLREAVQAANTNAAVDECPKGQASKPDIITLKAATYTLTLAGNLEDDNATGDLDALAGGPLEVRGTGRKKTEIVATSSDRVIDALSGDRLKLAALSMSGGGGSTPSRGGVVRADSDEVESADLVLDRVRVRNGISQFGGGLGMVSGRLRIKRSVFANNLARVTSTGLPGVHAVGGAMELLFSINTKISDTTFSNNDAVMKDSTAQAGGISILAGTAPVVIRRSLFSGNDVYSSTSDNSTVREGGAIHVDSDGTDLRVVNSTFYLNRAIGTGAGSRGAGVFFEGGSAELANATFSVNSAVSGSAIYAAGGSLELSRSALDGVGQGPLCGEAGTAFSSGGYNVAEPSPFGCDLDGPKDKLADPLLLAAPKANGGVTKTIGLKAASPAVNRIPTGKCGPAEGEDQRGFKRPSGKGCDSGAYERGAKRH